MLMVANIGSSVTSTIVSMSHIGNRKEFRKAISAATVHDFFNLYAIILFLPIDWKPFRLVEKLIGWLPMGAQYVVFARKP